jgi:hypothetical protein
MYVRIPEDLKEPLMKELKHLRHLNESEWRWNHRRDNLCSLLLKATRSRPLN